MSLESSSVSYFWQKDKSKKWPPDAMEYNEPDTLGEYSAEIQAEEVAEKVKKEQEKVVVQNAQKALNMLRPSSTPAPSPEVLEWLRSYGPPPVSSPWSIPLPPS